MKEKDGKGKKRTGKGPGCRHPACRCSEADWLDASVTHDFSNIVSQFQAWVAKQPKERK